MVLVVLLGLGWLCAPLGALAMDFNVKNSADAQGAQKGSQCASDDDCGTGKFCIKPRNDDPFCATCRRTRRRCQHANMCCPGMLCVNNICILAEDTPPELERGTDNRDDTGNQATNEHPVQENECMRKPSETPPVRTTRKRKRCLTGLHCECGFCCARHFRTRACKPLLLEGQVCSGRHRNTERVLDMFQRCRCKAGLVCRTQVAHRHHSWLHVCQQA